MVTRPDTVSDVFHFAVTRWVSRKKKAVAATSAIEIIQNETPTKSSDFNTAPEAAKALLGSKRPPKAKIAILETVELSQRFDVRLPTGFVLERLDFESTPTVAFCSARSGELAQVARISFIMDFITLG